MGSEVKGMIARRWEREARGFSLVEMLVVLALVSMALAALSGWAMSWAERQRESLSATHAATVANAAERYVADNASTLRSAASPTVAAQVTLSQLTTGNYLPTGFSTTNMHGQSYDIRVLEPTAGTLSTLIVTTGGETIAEASLRRIARQIGAEGGYVSTDTNSVATGSFQAWTATLTTYGFANGGGRIAAALFFRDGAQVTDYIYRNPVPSRPELQTMGTSLNMGGHSISNIGSLTLNSGLSTTAVTAAGRITAGEYLRLTPNATLGSTCPMNGLISGQVDGRPAVCISGAWRSMTY